jgi:hypothetical protein
MKDQLRKLGHAVLVLIAVLPWLISCLSFALALWLVGIADKTLPNANIGNCWSFVGPLWRRKGGYMAIRPARGFRFIPHALWVPKIPPELPVQQTVPIERATKLKDIWKTVYFKYKVVYTEKEKKP